jgi:RNA polymerase sigma-70 factor (ECF subfamily)
LDVEDRARSRSPAEERLPGADDRLLEQIRAGDAEAGQQFVHGHYRAIYRYLLYLTGQPDWAEDLTQETFLQGWRRLETFRGRGTLRGWLLRIAHREFLHRLQRRQAEPGLEGIAEVAAPDATAWTQNAELREAIDRLPLEQREVVLLHDLEGYSSSEIAPIVRAPASTVRRRLSQARERLRQALGEGDLSYLNELLAPMRQWHWLPVDQMHALETRLGPGGKASKEEGMERREFLRQAAVGAAGLMLPEAEKEVVDGRLTQKVTLAFKGTALSDLCEHLREETGVHVTAGPSVADEKVTLFCEKTPLREVMRQLSRPFGYTWLRSGKLGVYRYELVQDLRSQLLEEELRNRDRNAALLALEKGIERYRPFLHLSPDEALARAKTASPAERPLFEHLAHTGWGPIQMYFRLSPQQMMALRTGEGLTFSGDPYPDEERLPSDLAASVLQSCREYQVTQRDEGMGITTDLQDPKALPLSAVPEFHAQIRLYLQQSELGQFNLAGQSGYLGPNRQTSWLYGIYLHDGGNLAVGQSPAARQPNNAVTNAKLASDPVLQPRVSVQPEASYPAAISHPDPAGPGMAGDGSTTERKVTSAEVLEALHRATGMPIVADFYTRLYQRKAVSLHDQPLFNALNELADAMRLRWQRDREGGWLQFRSASYYHDRLKEVPNRLLQRWQAARREREMLTLDDLVEIAGLPDAQLDAGDMAEGAREIWGLGEWDIARNGSLRPHLRYLASFTPAQRREAQSPAGLAFTKMTLAQQQQFLANAISGRAAPLQSLDELAGSVLRVDYTQPGWFEWPEPEDWLRWRMMIEPGPAGRRELRAPIRERTREAAAAALRRLEPQVRAASGKTDVTPTRHYLAIVYIPGGTSTRRPLQVITSLEWTGVADF